ncbi:uncharacterized protein LOC136061660 [Quercus suber]|uniref:uncharacterized protein LOC136061660 n=1 Tax=Quercus suber TaxID=58331 RepID=UPI0032DF3130
MNIIIWNNKGALKPNFQNHARYLVDNHNPAIMVIMETHIGGDKAKEMTDHLPFDEAIHTKTIGYAGGLWLLWNFDRVDVSLLAKTEQEIHAVVKVQPFNINWLFTVVYASLRIAKRYVLWNNLCSTSNLIDMPWVIAEDFNEPLLVSDKYGGRAINTNNSLLFKEGLDMCYMIDLGFSRPRFTWTNKETSTALFKNELTCSLSTPTGGTSSLK